MKTYFKVKADHLENDSFRVGEMAQRFRVWSALVEDPDSDSSAHMVAHDFPELQCQGIWHPLLISRGTRHAHGTQAYMQAKHLHIKIKNKYNLKEKKITALEKGLHELSPNQKSTQMFR